MINTWSYVIMPILLTVGYSLIIIIASRSTRLIDGPYLLLTFLLSAGISAVFLTALDGALHLAYQGY